jgi:hypothetical protein
LALAYAQGTCEPTKVDRFKAAFKEWLDQTSYVAACWGALGSIGEKVSADHIKTLLTCCPCRQLKTNVARTMTCSPAYEVEVDLANAAFNDIVPDFLSLYPAGT